MNIAVVLAGGTGSRMGADRPKQFLMLDGEEVIAHSIIAFDQSPCIDEVAIVVHPDWLDHVEQLVRSHDWCKVHKIIPGGSERYLSSVNAIKAYSAYPDDTNIILHDAARPWISQKVIERVALSLVDNEAVAVGVPSTDTVWQIDPASQTIQQIPLRNTMWRAQTPQAFRLSLIRRAYDLALADPRLQVSDDCGVLMRYLPEYPITIVEGEESNKKITFKGDIPCMSSD